MLHDNKDKQVLSNLEEQFKKLTGRSGLSNTIEFGKLDSDRRTASTQLRGSKLNKDALEVLSAESGTAFDSARGRLRSSAGA